MNNWKLKPSCTKTKCPNGSGGFMPFGLPGVITGAATCFYGFIGFDCVATTGEEAKNPQRSIPIAIIVSLTVVFLAYFGVSTILTTVLPYYEQNADAPFPYMFDYIGWKWARYLVSAGAICGLCARLVELVIYRRLIFLIWWFACSQFTGLNVPAAESHLRDGIRWSYL